MTLTTRTLQQTAVARLTADEFLYLSRHPIPFPRLPVDDQVSEVTE